MDITHGPGLSNYKINYFLYLDISMLCHALQPWKMASQLSSLNRNQLHLCTNIFYAGCLLFSNCHQNVTIPSVKFVQLCLRRCPVIWDTDIRRCPVIIISYNVGPNCPVIIISYLGNVQLLTLISLSEYEQDQICISVRVPCMWLSWLIFKSLLWKFCVLYTFAADQNGS